ncbi:MAG: glycoside hydrolase family 30 beta sandwich domain-containing protein [bacterium]
MTDDAELPRTSNDVSRRRFLETSMAGLGAAALPAFPTLAHHAALTASAPAPAGAIDVRQTAGTNHYIALPALAWTARAQGASVDIDIQSGKKKQEILGFGAAFTDAACYMFSRLAPEARQKLFNELYHPSQMNLTVARTCIGSSDYSTKAYSYDDSDTPDPTLSKFSIAHDKQWILPMLREARQVNPQIYLLSTPWTPPGWMKDNNSLLGGTFRRRYKAEYARYFTKFLQAYAAEGVVVDAVSPQNEVDTDQDGNMPQCTWPQEMEVSFVGEHLGPALVKAGLKTKIWIIDHNYNLWGRALASFEDDKLRQYTDGVAWHGYLGTPEKMTTVHDAYPDKHAYWTEGGPDYSDAKYLTDWSKWGAQFTGILRNWARCIIAWNYALDEKGKPNIGPFPCGGVVTINSQTREITRSGQYWAFAHFSRHVKRGARVVDSVGTQNEVSHVAFENPDGSGVLVLTNNGKAAATRQIGMGKSAARVTLPADSVTTLSWHA